MSLLGQLLDLYCQGKLCIYCVARFSFRIGERYYSQSMEDIINNLFQAEKREVVHPKTNCVICFNMSIYFQSDEIVERIHEALKESGHIYEGTFYINTSFPQAIFVREMALCRYITRTFPSKNYSPFRLKDTLRFILMTKIKDWKCELESPLKLTIEFTHQQLREDGDKLIEISVGKKRKRMETLTSTIAMNIIENIPLKIFEESFTIPPTRNEEDPGTYKFIFERDYIYVGGRYRKYSRQLSQSQWIIQGKEMHEHSITKEIGEVLKKYFECDEYFMIASGREDVDVRMLGNGRPFVFELHNPRKVTLPIELYAQIQEEINKSPAIQVMHLQPIEAKDVDIIKKGEREKRKRYLALIWAESMKELKIKDLLIQQKTPIRVLHRRSLLTRERMIYSLELHPIDGHFGLLELETQAGTYIKEFVHGDLGRTTPNIIELLGCNADILSLDVVEVLLDFPKECRPEKLRPVTFDIPPFITLNEQQKQKCKEIIN
ncbi:hypothetical protein EHI8A_125040 [Entamoeba histolytica HM-1:IMSS-B]|uniref:tRNA pseudouridine(55) synthase n=6 Tax=Entamoeba histolytica TaxID=5759 RepID=C4LXV5_ENTH1|nr:hypothetical protein, conserved [Entamoeba histolytica HM-1:IMSS]EMD45758.1 coiledcoil domain containing protein [Entamoeba histolytica KU27]EMH77431.1 hypothetical protein EHI8A_125040 [Entamoeba histolytica HM-1:IMSS-B]EMS13459.1 coiled-coil domain containing protein [Entamoeba histolytica HM-3:IMSS]ENY59845.1 coiled-coil domain containing protein [Entamoeba histolytica HM-1:IMSS-A]GAT93606.1 hypothetical protein conserved [Entamoeba histolytica]|eukprot:XP_655941.1 hypothetical protein, conserved [Entamoeba histolytica HM-1:IMSS]